MTKHIVCNHDRGIFSFTYSTGEMAVVDNTTHFKSPSAFFKRYNRHSGPLFHVKHFEKAMKDAGVRENGIPDEIKQQQAQAVSQIATQFNTFIEDLL